MSYFQNRVAGSRMLLPGMIVYLAAVVAVAMWGGMSLPCDAVAVAMLGISVAMMAEMNNANSLIRIYSRMVSASFIAFTMMMPSWLSSVGELVAQACFAVSLYLIMPAYHDPSRMGRVFYSFLFIGVATLVCPQLLPVLPVLLLCLFLCILAPSFRQFVAALLGVAYPWTLYAVWAFYAEKTDLLADKAMQATAFSPLLEPVGLDVGQIAPIILVNAVVIIGSAHFFLNSYADKVRTRQIFEFFIMIHFFLLIAMILQPAHAQTLFALQLCVAAPVAGHFAALSSSRLSNATFVGIILCILAITAYNLWMLY